LPAPANSPTDPPGLRERKKQRTRELIAERARELFVARGFEQVTVAEIARASEVSEKTVYNYFPSKEDLVFWRFESFEQELLDAIREREPGESVLAGFGRFVLQRRGLLAEQDATTRALLTGVTRMIAESPSLLAREQQIFESYTRSLADLIAGELGADCGDLEPWVAANALMGVHRALVAYARSRLLVAERTPDVASEVLARGTRALAALEHGLGGYAVKREQVGEA
jgi:AcrR family transcriptional regulator